MRVWTIANQKGGVGKTTTTVALGGLSAAWGFRTLMIDIDPHGSLSSYFRLDPDKLESSSYSLFEAVADNRTLDPRSLVLSTATEGLDLIPAAVALATLDRQSGRRAGLGLVLQRAVDQLRDHYDYILIDCPPVVGCVGDQRAGRLRTSYRAGADRVSGDQGSGSAAEHAADGVQSPRHAAGGRRCADVFRSAHAGIA